MKIIKFSEFDVINEMKLPIMKLDELLDEVSKISNNTLKSVLVAYYKTYMEYIDLTDKTKHIFRVNDMTGDVLNNNRISYDVMIFDEADLQTIIKNTVDYSIGEFYNSLPNTIDVFGNVMNPSSFINKDELRDVFNGQLPEKSIIDIISGVTGFKYDNKYNTYYIWNNKK